VAYTNAAAIVSEEFQDTEDLDGLFSGYDPEKHTYDHASWAYQGAAAQAEAGDPEDRTGAHGGSPRADTYGSGGAAINYKPDTDPTLRHPRCVYQLLKRHYARSPGGRTWPGSGGSRRRVARWAAWPR
jgi:formate dehydrogenase major subunit